MPTVTINGNDYDTYADLPTALVYWAGQIEATDIMAMTSDQQSAALVSMTRVIDRQVWQGEQTDGYETHAFPRSGLTYADGTPVDSGSVPCQIAEACMEGASQLASGASFQDQANTFNTTKTLKAGSVEIDYFRQLGPFSRFPQTIQELVGLWLGGRGNVFGSESTGTGAKTIFNEQYDVNRGF